MNVIGTYFTAGLIKLFKLYQKVSKFLITKYMHMLIFVQKISTYSVN